MPMPVNCSPPLRFVASLAKNDIDNLAMNYINDRVAPNVGIKWD
jgi:hypothetical protein